MDEPVILITIRNRLAEVGSLQASLRTLKPDAQQRKVQAQIHHLQDELDEVLAPQLGGLAVDIASALRERLKTRVQGVLRGFCHEGDLTAAAEAAVKEMRQWSELLAIGDCGSSMHSAEALVTRWNQLSEISARI
jgi:ElaB/YqjD/DUF883 family membrane-anchored ribosome-binding protein